MVRIETDHRFIEHEHFRRVQQRGDNRYALAGAMRKPFDQLAEERFEVETGNPLARGGLDLRFAHLEELAGEAEKLPRRQFVVEEGKIGHVSQAAARFHRLLLHIETGQAGRAGSRFDEAGEDANGGGFARGVGPEHSEEFTARNGQTDVANRSEVSEALHQVY